MSQKSRHDHRSVNRKSYLSVNISTNLILGVLLTFIFLLFLWFSPFQDLRELLYERTFTQFFVVFFTFNCLVFLSKKLIRNNNIKKSLGDKKYKTELWKIRDEVHKIKIATEDDLSKEFNDIKSNYVFLSHRYRRILKQYIKSKSFRQTSLFAESDAAYQQSVSSSSYIFPRILVWSIPLWGFVGTVIGISEAIGKFPIVLESSSDITGIKDSIGDVISSLSIAFDTTFVALLSSIILMILVTMFETWENRLLVEVEKDIEENLLQPLSNDIQSQNKNIKNSSISKEIENQLHILNRLVGTFTELLERSQKTDKELLNVLYSIKNKQYLNQLVDMIKDVLIEIIKERDKSILNSFFKSLKDNSTQLITKVDDFKDEFKSINESNQKLLRNNLSNIKEKMNSFEETEKKLKDLLTRILK